MSDQDELRAADRPRRDRASGCAAGARRRARPRSRRALAAGERRRLPRAAHRAGAGARVDGSAARRGAGHVRRRAPPDHLARPGCPRRLDADGPAARRARRCRQARARAPRDRRADAATAPCSRAAASSASRGSSPRSSRPPSSCSTSATSTPPSSPRCGSRCARRCERFARGGEHRGRVGADLADRADPVRRDAGRLRRRGDPRGRRHVAPAAERPAARRRRGLPRGRADGDAVRPEPARPLPHEARGHASPSTSSSRSRRSTGWRRRRSPGRPSNSLLLGARSPAQQLAGREQACGAAGYAACHPAGCQRERAQLADPQRAPAATVVGAKPPGIVLPPLAVDHEEAATTDSRAGFEFRVASGQFGIGPGSRRSRYLNPMAFSIRPAVRPRCHALRFARECLFALPPLPGVPCSASASPSCPTRPTSA